MSVSLYVSMCTTRVPGAQGGHLLELEFQRVVSSHVGAEKGPTSSSRSAFHHGSASPVPHRCILYTCLLYLFMCSETYQLAWGLPIPIRDSVLISHFSFSVFVTFLSDHEHQNQLHQLTYFKTFPPWAPFPC